MIAGNVIAAAACAPGSVPALLVAHALGRGRLAHAGTGPGVDKTAPDARLAQRMQGVGAATMAVVVNGLIVGMPLAVAAARRAAREPR